MDTHDRDTEPAEEARGAIARVRGGLSGVVGRVPAIAGKTRDRAEQIAGRVPDAYERAQSGARRAVTGLQQMPDSRLGLLAAASVGFGAGLRLAGASRLATLAGFAPASVLGFAIWSRPGKTRPAAHKV